MNRINTLFKWASLTLQYVSAGARHSERERYIIQYHYRRKWEDIASGYTSLALANQNLRVKRRELPQYKWRIVKLIGFPIV